MAKFSEIEYIVHQEAKLVKLVAGSYHGASDTVSCPNSTMQILLDSRQGTFLDSRQGTLLQLLQKDGRLFLGNLEVVVGVVQLEQLRLAMLPKGILQEKYLRGFRS